MAKAQDKTVEEKLQAMFDLQVIDSKIDEIQVLRGELPMEVKDLEDEIEGLRTRLNKLETSVKKYEDEIARYRSSGKEAETLILRYQKQLDDVKNNREYEALNKEIDLQRLEIQLAEKKQKGSQKMIDDKSVQLNSTKERIDGKEKELEDKKVELEKITKSTEKEEEKLTKKSVRGRKGIEERLLRAYDKVRGAYRNGLAVATVERDSCGGCFNKIPPQTQLEIGQRKKIIVCEHCGRVLVDNEIAGIVEPTEA